MIEEIEYLIAEFDFLLAQGREPIEAWHQALKDYAFVYHTDDGRLPLGRAAEVALQRMGEEKDDNA